MVMVVKFSLIEARTDLGVNIDGSNLGPKKISNHFKKNKNISKIIEIEKDKINKSEDPNDLAKNLNEINSFNEKLYNTVINIKNDNEFPIILGGDHSLAIGSALGSINKEKKLGIIWIDAHIDYNTFETTITGNIHGLPLAATNGLNKKLSLFHKGNYFSPANTVVIGYRAEEENKYIELKNIANMGVTVFTTNDIKNLGIKKVVEKAVEIATKNTNGIHISYDLDVIDPEVSPGVNTPIEDGLNLKEAFGIIDELLNNKNPIKSMDLVEFNPNNDIDKTNETIADDIVKKVIKNLS